MGNHQKAYKVKRVFDLAIVALVAIPALPICLTIAGLAYFFEGSPIFFRQWRAGLKGKPIQIIKFRSMTNSVDSHGELLPDAERLTGFGRFLRASSLDELPELINVLKGEMSLV